MKQEGSGAIKSSHRKQTEPCCPSAAGNHCAPAAEDERLDGDIDFIEKISLKQCAIHGSAAENRNSFVLTKKFRKINMGRIDKGNRPSVLHRL